MIKPDRIGHLVLKVRNLDTSLSFYSDMLGLQVMNTSIVPRLKIAFLAAQGRDHHELALLEVGPDAETPAPHTVGLSHFAFRVTGHQELEDAYNELKAHGVEVHFTVDHGVCKGVYFHDPDGNELEVYADNPVAEYSAMENPYMGFEKLSFAAGERGMLDVLAP